MEKQLTLEIEQLEERIAPSCTLFVVPNGDGAANASPNAQPLSTAGLLVGGSNPNDVPNPDTPTDVTTFTCVA